MINKRKIPAVLIAFSVLAAAISINAYAASPALSVSEGTSMELDYDESGFSFDVSINDVSQAYASAVFDVTYDSPTLSLDKAANTGGGYDVKYSEVSGGGRTTVTVGVANGENVLSGDEDISRLTFIFNGDPGDTAIITISNGAIVRIINASDGEVEKIDISGSVSIKVTKAEKPAVTETPSTPTPSPDGDSDADATPAPTSNASSGSYGGSGSTNESSASATETTLSVNEDQTPLGPVLASAGGVQLAYTGAGYINGFPDGTIRPDGNLTRGQMAVILYLLTANKEYTGTAEISFTDLSPGEYHYEAVMYLAGHGILSGYPDGTFRAESSITRAEAVTILSHFADGGEDTAEAPVFSDISGHWAEEYINAYASSGRVSGYPDGTFRPDGQITRAEIISLINRALAIDAAALAQGKENRFTDLSASHWAYADILAVTIGD